MNSLPLQKMKKKNSSVEYIVIPDYHVAGLLEQGDQFLYKRNVNGEFKFIECTVSYTPVFFKHSLNWTIRATFKIKNNEINEYFYANKNTIKDFRFHPKMNHKYLEHQISSLKRNKTK